MITDILIGADPELFIKKDNEIVSAIDTIKAGKNNPKYITEEGHAIQEDNVMVEFNIPPSSSKEEFLENINYVKDYLKVYYELLGYELDFRASALLDKKYLKHPKAKVFGCEPDFNVYAKNMNKPPKGGNIRSAGGHIHVGYGNPDQEVTEKIVKAMDITLGLDSIILDPDTRRRSMYGKAGSFRFKPYGLEYRTLSNFWIANNKLIGWTYDKTLKAIDMVDNGQIDVILERYESDIEQAINTNDVKLSIDIALEIETLNKKEKIK